MGMCMQFTSFNFAVFFPLVVLCFYMMPKKARSYWLLAASYYFYMGWSPKYAVLILTSTIITYVCARVMECFENTQKLQRRLVLLTGLVSNLAILIFFKYFYFLHETIAELMAVFGVALRESELDIILPVGISFYTFQALGYMLDVYRGEIKAESNFINYALFVSFFPQLVAGPIERSKNLLGQIKIISERPSWNFEKVTRGLLLMLWGYFMKMVIADRAAILVDEVFGAYYMLEGVALLFGGVLFLIQLYCDFASYSAIAIGAANILGIQLMQNFAAPFFSKSIGEFWRRWHISLSSWLRDYIYIPLGGSRCSKARYYLNTMITFLISGLWHGASWHFVFWGAIQGGMIVVGDILRPIKKKLNTMLHIRIEKAGYQALQVLVTFALSVVSFIFFRAESVHDGIYYLERMITRFDIWSLTAGNIYHMGLDEKEMEVLFFAIFILILVDWLYEKKKMYFDTLVKGQSLVAQYLISIVLLVMILVFGIYGQGYDATQFIYFQF